MHAAFLTRSQLGPRLSALARLCGQGQRVVDVGCDHSLLSLALLESGHFQEALAIDIQEEPLRRAQERLDRWIATDKLPAELATRIHYQQNDGLADLSLRADDCLVIAGMGGMEIHKILGQTQPDGLAENRIVLSPQRSQTELLYALMSQGAAPEQYLMEQDGYRYLLLRVEGVPFSGEIPLRDPESIRRLYSFTCDAETLSPETRLRFLKQQKKRLRYDLQAASRFTSDAREETQRMHPARAAYLAYLSQAEVQASAQTVLKEDV